ncbi:hypothetical protein TNCV_1399631 [Trichonephila clavipes]|nr:hypothetical protein TNCV_1399631 [Trichonephila clavipes]
MYLILSLPFIKIVALIRFIRVDSKFRIIGGRQIGGQSITPDCQKWQAEIASAPALPPHALWMRVVASPSEAC